MIDELTYEKLSLMPVYGKDLLDLPLNRGDCRTWVCPKCQWLVDIPWEFRGIVKCGLDPTFLNLPGFCVGYINNHDRCTMALVIIGDESDHRYVIDLLDYVLDAATEDAK